LVDDEAIGVGNANPGEDRRAGAAGAAAPASGSPFTAIEFDGMTVTPYVDASRCAGDGKNKCAARQAYSLKAAGVRAPSRGMTRPAPESHKDAA
jgi:hypothetical protein